MKFESNLPNGLFAASLTPLNDDLSVNYEALIKHINWLFEQGANGICLLGTTGEANSFSVDERMAVLDYVVSHGIDPQLLLVGTGTCNLPETIALTRHAVEKGVGGILMLPPFYYKNPSDNGILTYFQRVIDGVDDARLKIYIYHFPKMTGVPFTLPLIEQLVEQFPETIVGMKDSSGDLEGMQKICESIPGFKIYAGSERFLLDNLRCGAPGCISATFNASMRYGAELYKHWQDDHADELQSKLSEVRAKFEITAFVSGLKFLFAHWQEEESWLNMRPPNSLPAKEVKEQLLETCKREDFI